jgi:hypothetical protein
MLLWIPLWLSNCNKTRSSTSNKPKLHVVCSVYSSLFCFVSKADQKWTEAEIENTTHVPQPTVQLTLRETLYLQTNLTWKLKTKCELNRNSYSGTFQTQNIMVRSKHMDVTASLLEADTAWRRRRRLCFVLPVLSFTFRRNGKLYREVISQRGLFYL